MKKRGKDLPESCQRALRERRLILRKLSLILVLVVSMGLVVTGMPEITNPESGSGINSVTVLQVQSQERTIRGIVTDTDNQPMPGVTVQLKGTTIGTLTDASGAYQIRNVPPNSILVVSFIGMTTREIAIGDQTEINVTLSESTLNLDEVVVIGYGTQRRQEVTGAVGSVKEDGFNRGVILSPEQLMQGKVSGVNITTRSGEPGEAQTIVIRGPGSVRTGSGPLYVIDGVPIDNTSNTPSVGSAIGTSGASNPLNFLNPADIASIDVLKDASSTAIYGSRGANGVIMITTKKGTTNEQFNYSSSFSISQVASKLKVLSTQEFIDYTTQYGDPSVLKIQIQTGWTRFTGQHLHRITIYHLEVAQKSQNIMPLLVTSTRKVLWRNRR